MRFKRLKILPYENPYMYFREARHQIETPKEVVNTLLRLFACDIDHLDASVLKNVLRNSGQYCDQNHFMKERHFIGMGRFMNRNTVRYLKDNRFMFSERSGNMLRYYSPECFESVRNTCSNAKQRIVKTIRLSMDLVKTLMKLLPNLKVIYLTRDPRAITNSRAHSSNMKTAIATESHSKALCGQLRRDIEIGHNLREQYPNRLAFVLYEDIAKSPIEEAKHIFEFLNVQFEREIEQWIYSSTHASKNNGFYGTQRMNSEVSAVQWRKDISFNKTLIIQKYCGDVLNALGFRSFQTDKELINLTIPTRN